MLSKEETNNNILTILQKRYKFKIEHASFAQGFIPSFILLDRTRNIHSYLVPISQEVANSLHDTSKEISNYLNYLQEYYKIQYSQLDRPLFLLFENGKSVDFLDISNLKKFLKKEETFDQFLDYKIEIDSIFTTIKSEL